MNLNRRAFPWKSGWRHCVLASLLVLACQTQGRDGVDGETHFLKSCSPSKDSCGDGLKCLCGVCSLACNQSSTCEAFGGAVCVEQADACGSSGTMGHCDVGCESDSNCSFVSPFHVCDNGMCRTQSPGSASEGPAPTQEAAPDSGTLVDCPLAEASPNEMLIIGDSYFAGSHEMTAFLEDLARKAGVLAPGERYRDSSRVTTNTLALGGQGITGQYDEAVADSPAKVVVMNGGGADALLTSCAATDASCSDFGAAANAAETLLAEMSANGVQQVVYAYYPDVADVGLRERIDTLRTMLEPVCTNSSVPCRWLDLRSHFGEHDEYFAPGGTFPSTDGSRAMAEAIWALLIDGC